MFQICLPKVQREVCCNMKCLGLKDCRVDLTRVKVPMKKCFVVLRRCPSVAKVTLPLRSSLWKGLEVKASPGTTEPILELSYEGVSIQMGLRGRLSEVDQDVDGDSGYGG